MSVLLDWPAGLSRTQRSEHEVKFADAYVLVPAADSRVVLQSISAGMKYIINKLL